MKVNGWPDRLRLRLRLRSARPIGAPVLDGALVALCLALTVAAVKTPWAASPAPLSAAAGITGSLGLPFRRRYPVAAAAIGAAAMALSGNPGPLVITLFSAAAGRSRRGDLALLAGLGVTGFVIPEWVSDQHLSLSSVTAALTSTAVVLTIGTFLRTRRQLVASLRERAEQAEAQRASRDAQARAGERTRIAREMHDVLAHKIVLISLHAGGLEVNPAAGAEQVERSAALIRTTAQEALGELRTVLGVLRDDATGPGPGSDDPDPFADLGRLVTTWTEAGADVAMDDEVGPLPAVTARTAYRLVQEGLTNAHRYAPGSPVVVSLRGTPGRTVHVSVVNGPSKPGAPIEPGSGLGLIGLGERLRLAAGTVDHGRDVAGGWRLEAELPWPADTAESPARRESRGVS